MNTKRVELLVCRLMLVAFCIFAALHSRAQVFPLAQNIFPATKTGNDSGPEGNDYELGMVFRANTPGVISGVRVYALAAESGNHTVRLWRNSDGTLVAGR